MINARVYRNLSSDILEVIVRSAVRSPLLAWVRTSL